MPAQPEVIETAPDLHFEDAAREAAQPEQAPSVPENLKGTPVRIWTAYNIRIHMQERERLDPWGMSKNMRFLSASNARAILLGDICKSEEQPLTHDAWQSHWRNDRFVKWVIQGEGRIDINREGNAVAHVYYFGTARGENGPTILMPKGRIPPAPQSQPKRPAQSSSTEDEEEI